MALFISLPAIADEIVGLEKKDLPYVNEELRKLDIDTQIDTKGKLDLGSKKITNLATPTATTDGVNKAYVDGKVPIMYMVEDNTQTTKTSATWEDFLVTNVTLDEESDVLVCLSFAAGYETGYGEVAFRAKVGTTYSNPSLLEWIGSNRTPPADFSFLIPTVAAGTYSIGIQWYVIAGSITSSFYNQAYAYNRAIISVYQ